MKVTSKKTYRVIKAILTMKKFTQYEISKKEEITFSLVNKVVNWLVSLGYVAKRTGYYELVAPVAILSLFPIYRKIKPYAIFDVNVSVRDILAMLKGKGRLCLTSALAYYDDYFRDPAIHIYLNDQKIIEELKSLPKGYTHIQIYKEDLSNMDFQKKNGQNITDKTRTILDLFCANKGYTAERLIKKEWK
ncbi:MAG TPA: hypothetical protein VI912_03280 [Candidatus Bilamarchaeaceae archaeon]|nr:hypothetical protein [Candidatus Bilamarchaeaceae archaeon]